MNDIKDKLLSVLDAFDKGAQLGFENVGSAERLQSVLGVNLNEYAEVIKREVIGSGKAVDDNVFNNIVFECAITYVLFQKSPHSVWNEWLVCFEDFCKEINNIQQAVKMPAELRSRYEAILNTEKTNALNENIRQIENICKRLQDEFKYAYMHYVMDSVLKDCTDKLLRKTAYKLFDDFRLKRYFTKPAEWKSNYIMQYLEGPTCRCSFKKENKRAQIFAASYKDIWATPTNKPLHFGCEDCCGVKLYDDIGAFLAVSCDGVGSHKYSAYGSQAAVEAVYEVVDGYVQKLLTKNRTISQNIQMPIVATDKKGNICTDKKGNPKVNGILIANQNTVETSAGYELLFKTFREDFASELNNVWTDKIKAIDVYSQEDKDKFGSTLQFVFGCERFMVCGCVGDGNFYVRKKDCTGRYRIYSLGDGYSGIIDESICSLHNLETAESALQMRFFDMSDICDVLLSSDGADKLFSCGAKSTQKFFDNSGAAVVNAFIEKLDKMNFADRCEFLNGIVAQCADNDTTEYGKRDDATIVHVHVLQHGDKKCAI